MVARGQAVALVHPVQVEVQVQVLLVHLERVVYQVTQEQTQEHQDILDTLVTQEHPGFLERQTLVHQVTLVIQELLDILESLDGQVLVEVLEQLVLLVHLVILVCLVLMLDRAILE